MSRKFVVQQVARPVYYDRNPASIAAQYGATFVAPHGATVRASYTVPAGKKAFLEGALALIRRNGAAAPLGQAVGVVRFNSGGITQASYVRADLTNNTNGVVDRSQANGAGAFVAGDVIDILTTDSSTGGSCDYNVTFKAVEFDA